MEYFVYRDGELYCEGCRVSELAERYGTPLWVYSSRAIQDRYAELQRAFAELEPLICYSVKANSNLAILRLLAAEGSGFDVVSGGELERVRRAGGELAKVVFAGVGKTAGEIQLALELGILMFDVESEGELAAIGRIARQLGRPAPIALRVNPDVDPKTHRYITTGKKENKFGMDLGRALQAARDVANMRELRLIGVHMHIGSQITDPAPYAAAAARLRQFTQQLQELGHPVAWCNVGGGFGIEYRGGEANPAEAFASVIVPEVKATGCRLVLEPGRFIAGNAGILVGRVLYTKRSGQKRFAIQDAAMNDLIRPTLYGAYHRVWPVQLRGRPAPPLHADAGVPGSEPWDVVGPVCETGDFFAQDRPLPPLLPGDLLATFSAGAYGMTMSSNYNTRPRAAEVLVQADRARLIRRRETIDDLLAPELEVE